MRIVCQQTILLKYQTLFFSTIKNDDANFVVCCSCIWRIKGLKTHGSSLFSFQILKVINALNAEFFFRNLFSDGEFVYIFFFKNNN